MKLEIDIPSILYNDAKENRGYISVNKMEIAWKAIADGKPLEQEPKCKDCKWWKDSDGKYRRGVGAESQCPMNTHTVYCGDGYCYMFLSKAEK